MQSEGNKKETESNGDSIFENAKISNPPAALVESDEISISQLELMANKKKLNKKESEKSVEEIKPDIMSSSLKKKRTKSSDSSSTSMSMPRKSSSKNGKKENNNDDIRRKKCEYLYKLEKLAAKRKVIDMTMNNTLDEIRNEYERICNEMKNERSVAFLKRMMLLGVQGFEMLNNKFDPLGVDLDGWSESMGYSLENQEYDEVLSELYEKYKGSGQMSPELKLIFMIISSATMFTISKKITKMDSSNMFKNMFGGLMNGNGNDHGNEVPPQNVAMTETTEDVMPSKLSGPQSVDINNILKTMQERKNEKVKGTENEESNSEVLFKTIAMKNKKRGRPKKTQVLSNL
jgi:hypothetical protein